MILWSFLRCYICGTFNSLRHSASLLTFGLQAQSRGCAKLLGVKGWFVETVVRVEAGLYWVKAGWCKRWFVGKSELCKSGFVQRLVGVKADFRKKCLA